jgi:hypothetical protein
MKHTPGPWRTFVWNEFAGEAVIQKVVVINDNKEIAKFSRGTDEVMANARLIAAAPELLEALEMLAAVDFGADGSVERGALLARIAIAKARGE